MKIETRYAELLADAIERQGFFVLRDGRQGSRAIKGPAVNIHTLAKILGVADRTAWGWTSDGGPDALASAVFEGRTYIDLADVERFIFYAPGRGRRLPFRLASDLEKIPLKIGRRAADE